ncbi:hypothetical protein GW17_00014699 [Ensete ventricosum]|nr:hypothetical protein GW17_00014699 [Ensete ventricosum]RZR91548.1 hypothetical protein BHM03_00019688 [Ensete ventricosum]
MSFVVGPDTWQEDGPPEVLNGSGPGIPGTLLEPHGPTRGEKLACRPPLRPTPQRDSPIMATSWTRGAPDGTGAVRCAVTAFIFGVWWGWGWGWDWKLPEDA